MGVADQRGSRVLKALFDCFIYVFDETAPPSTASQAQRPSNSLQNLHRTVSVELPCSSNMNWSILDVCKENIRQRGVDQKQIAIVWPGIGPFFSQVQLLGATSSFCLSREVREGVGHEALMSTSRLIGFTYTYRTYTYFG